jgi:phospholipase/carboxylesterase
MVEPQRSISLGGLRYPVRMQPPTVAVMGDPEPPLIDNRSLEARPIERDPESLVGCAVLSLLDRLRSMPWSDMPDDRHQARLRFQLRPAATSRRGFDCGRDEPLGLDDERDGLLYVPDTAEPGAPVLVFLHGANGSGRGHLRAVLAAADRYGVVLAAPDSRNPTTWDLIAERRFGPDVAFLDQVLDTLVDQLDLDIDTARLAIGGVSDGASYALALGLSNGDIFSTVLAFSPGFLVAPEPAGQPRIFVSHGTADPILPIDACSRSFVPVLRQAGYEVRFHEFDGGHTVPPPVSDEAMSWWLSGERSLS